MTVRRFSLLYVVALACVITFFGAQQGEARLWLCSRCVGTPAGALPRCTLRVLHCDYSVRFVQGVPVLDRWCESTVGSGGQCRREDTWLVCIDYRCKCTCQINGEWTTVTANRIYYCNP